MEKYTNLQYSQERALFSTKDAKIEKCVFKDGESPLKESSQLLVKETTFCWKYPLWYCRDIDLYKSNGNNCFSLTKINSGCSFRNFLTTVLVSLRQTVGKK